VAVSVLAAEILLYVVLYIIYCYSQYCVFVGLSRPSLTALGYATEIRSSVTSTPTFKHLAPSLSFLTHYSTHN